MAGCSKKAFQDRASRWLIKCMSWLARITLLVYVIAGITFLDFKDTYQYYVAAFYALVALTYVWLEFWTRSQKWRHQENYRSFAIWVLALAVMNITAPVNAHKLVDPMFFKLAVAEGTSLHTWPYHMPNLIEAGEVRHSGLHWSLKSEHGEEHLTFVAEFRDADVCRDLLANSHWPTLGIVSVQLGDEEFNGWPRKHLREKHCSDTAIINYKY